MSPLEQAAEAFSAASQARARGQIAAEAVRLEQALCAFVAHMTGGEVLRQTPTPEAYTTAFLACGDADVRFGMALGALRMGKAHLDLGMPELAHLWLCAGEPMMGRFSGDEEAIMLCKSAVAHAAALRMLHRHDEAEDRLDFARSVVPPHATLDRQTIEMAQANLCSETGRREEAVALLLALERSVDSKQQPVLAGTVLAALALNSDMRSKRYAQAIDRLLRARALLDGPEGDRQRLAAIEKTLALAARVADDPDAAEYAATALARNAANPNPDLEWRCLEVIAAAMMANGQEALSTLLWKMTVASLQTLRRRRLGGDDDFAEMEISSPGFAFDVLAATLARQGRFGEAREVMSLKLAAVAKSEEPGVPGMTPSEQAGESRLRESLAIQARGFRPSELMRALNQIASEMEHSDAQIRNEAAQWNEQLRQRSLAGLPPDAVSDTLILHVIQDEGILTLAAQVNGVELLPAGTQTPLSARDVNAMVAGFVTSLMRDDVKRLQELGSELTRLLLAPVMATLPDGVTRLLVSAPGPLHNLPWAALPLGTGFLIERFDLVRATVPDVDLRCAPQAPLRLLACGCSAPGHEPLPHAAIEVGSLMAERVLDTPETFTRAKLTQCLPHATVLHVASHFMARSANVMHSRLLLGDGTELDLSKFAALGLNHLDLLVLSTCESGLASGAQLQENFAVDHVLQAGDIPAIVGTLFPVSDNATAELMRRFHAHLRAGDDKAHALAAAQRSLLAGHTAKDWRAPRFWAAPMLSGNWQGWRTSSTHSG